MALESFPLPKDTCKPCPWKLFYPPQTAKARTTGNLSCTGTSAVLGLAVLNQADQNGIAKALKIITGTTAYKIDYNLHTKHQMIAQEKRFT